MARFDYNQQKRFIEAVIPFSLLDEVVEWIADTCSPEDVFSLGDLHEWALNHGFVEATG